MHPGCACSPSKTMCRSQRFLAGCHRRPPWLCTGNRHHPETRACAWLRCASARCHHPGSRAAGHFRPRTSLARLREWYAHRICEHRRHAAAKATRSPHWIWAPTTTRPSQFGIGELLARLRVAQRHLAERSGSQAQSRIQAGALLIDFAERQRAARWRQCPSPADRTACSRRWPSICSKVLTHRQLLPQMSGGAARSRISALPAHLHAPHCERQDRSRACLIRAIC